MLAVRKACKKTALQQRSRGSGTSQGDRQKEAIFTNTDAAMHERGANLRSNARAVVP